MKEILLTSSVLILALVLLRLLFRRTVSRRVQYALWGLVLLRLLIPVSLPAMKYSVLTAAEPVRDTAAWELASAVSGLHVPRMSWTRAYNEVLAEHEAAGPAAGPLSESELDSRAYARMSSSLTIRDALHLIWYVGMGFMALLLLLVNLRFALKLRRTRVPLEGTGSRYPVYLCDDIPSPCLFGLLRPAVYVTSLAARDPDTLRYVLAHEETHARHLDPLWSLLRSLCLAVWWFDPLVWLAARLSKLDCELACDEGTLERLGEGERAPYGETLLRLIPLGRGGDPLLSATTMTAGKRQMKDRIRRIAEHRKPLVIALIVVLVLAALVCACTFTGARREHGPEVTGATVFDGPEAYLEHLLRHTTGLTYTTEAGETREPETRVGELRKEAELAGLHSQGTLELYAYRIEYRLEGADPEDVLTLPGVTYVTEEGWCDLNGPHSLILLRREDGSVSVLFDRIDGDDRGGLYYYEESPEEMLYDWYARNHDPYLPPYTIDLLPADRGGNHPARRYDGEGWYIYIPIPAWEEQRGEGLIRWVSRYGTGSSITVRESSLEEATADPLRQPEPGQMWLYALGEDGRYWYAETRYDPERITDAPEVRDEPRLLEAMLESFRGRTGKRVTEEAPTPDLTKQLRAAADRIFGTPQVPPAGPCFLSVEAEGRRDEYRLVPGQTWSLDQNMGYLLTAYEYKWHTLTEEEIAAVVRDPASGPVMEIWNETDRFTIYADGDALLWTELESGTEHWLCPEPRREYTGPLYDYLLSNTARIAEMYRAEAQITVPGTVTDYGEVARQMAEQYAAMLLDRPGWYVGVPEDAAVDGVSVFDAYYGEDYPNFCFGMGFYLKLSHDPADPDRGVFEAGAGLGEPVAEGPYAGWYRWGGEVSAALEEGVWRFLGMGTGGYAIWLPYGVGWTARYEQLTTEQLVSLFFLTDGDTHEWNLLHCLSQKPVEEVRAELEKRSEAQRQELLRGMEGYNAEFGQWYGLFDLSAYS